MRRDNIYTSTSGGKKMENQNLPAIFKRQAIEILPDTDRYKCRVKVRSASSNSLYLVSYDVAIEAWVCSCRGNIAHGHCKHLAALGLKGRKFGKCALDYHLKAA